MRHNVGLQPQERRKNGIQRKNRRLKTEIIGPGCEPAAEKQISADKETTAHK